MANNSSRRTDKVVFIGDELAYALESMRRLVFSNNNLRGEAKAIVGSMSDVMSKSRLLAEFVKRLQNYTFRTKKPCKVRIC